MTKIAPITTCHSCPFAIYKGRESEPFTADWNGSPLTSYTIETYGVCGKNNEMEIEDVMVIPPWCPLEDYKENELNKG